MSAGLHISHSCPLSCPCTQGRPQWHLGEFLTPPVSHGRGWAEDRDISPRFMTHSDICLWSVLHDELSSDWMDEQAPAGTFSTDRAFLIFFHKAEVGPSSPVPAAALRTLLSCPPHGQAHALWLDSRAESLGLQSRLGCVAPSGSLFLPVF